MFSATVMTGTSMKCWCTIPIPWSIASRGEWSVTGSPRMAIWPAVGPVQPVEDVHQRRLPGPVLAEQGVNLALPQIEVDSVVRDDAGEPLRNSRELEERSVRHLVCEWGDRSRPTRFREPSS